MKKIISQLFVLALFVIAFVVAKGLIEKKTMWEAITLYWIVLTFKNLFDFIVGML